MNPDEVAVILPARNEAGAVSNVVAAFRAYGARVVVVDNGSTDATARLAAEAGAEVVHEPRPGYGAACLRGMDHLRADPPQIIVFADCDGTLDAADLQSLLEPIRIGTADLVLGRRTRIEPGAYRWHQRAGNALVLGLLRLVSGVRLADLPPFRAVQSNVLFHLDLREPTYGFPVETVAAALACGLRVQEVGVSYLRRRTGQSKVSGSLPRSIAAGMVMIRALARAWRRGRRRFGTVVVFARAPELGQVKTRLATKYPQQTVLRLYRAFLSDTLRSARLSGARVVLAHTPSTAFEEQALADICVEQVGESFGERFDHALTQTRRLIPKGPLLIVGADTPHLSPVMIRDALKKIASGRAVIGPAPRGGFYALGLPENPPSVESVFREQAQIPALQRLLSTAGLQTLLLDAMFDVDEPGDIERLAAWVRSNPAWTPMATAHVLSDPPFSRSDTNPSGSSLLAPSAAHPLAQVRTGDER